MATLPASRFPDDVAGKELKSQDTEGLRARWARSHLPLVFLALFALLLRLRGLDAESLWLDEGYSIRDAHHLSSFNRQRPVYFLLLRFWMLFGDSDFWLRLPAVLFGVGSIVMLYCVALHLADRRAALLACLFMSVCVRELDHSQEVRMYTLASFLTLAALYLLLRWLKTPGFGRLAGYVACAWLALATTPVCLLPHGMAVALACIHLRSNRRALGMLLASQAALLLLWLPLALLARTALQDFTGPDRLLQRPTPLQLVGFFPTLLTYGIDFNAPGRFGRYLPYVFPIGMLLLSALPVLCARRNASARSAPYVFVWFAALVLGLYAYSQVRSPLWSARYFHPILPGLYLLMSLGILCLARFSRPAAWLTGALLAGILLLSARNYHVLPVREDWRGAAAWVQRHARDGDSIGVGVYVNGKGQWDDDGLLWKRYYRGKGEMAPVGLTVRFWETATERHAADLLAQMPPTSGRAWLLLRRGIRINRSGLLAALEAEIARRYRPEPQLRHAVPGIDILCYAPRRSASSRK